MQIPQKLTASINKAMDLPRSIQLYSNDVHKKRLTVYCKGVIVLKVLSVAKIVHSNNNIRIMRQTPLRRSRVGLPVFKHHIPWSGILPSWANRWAKAHSGPPLAPPVTVLYIWVPLRVLCLAFYIPNFEILHYNLLQIKNTKSTLCLKVQSHLLKLCLRQDIYLSRKWSKACIYAVSFNLPCGYVYNIPSPFTHVILKNFMNVTN